MLSGNKQDACFIKQIHGEADNGEGESVSSWGDDGCNDKNCDKSMAAHGLHFLAVQNAEFTKQP